MDEQRNRYLLILGQLAREYQEKFAELEVSIQGAPNSEVIQQLGALGELTTDRFRAAQQAMFEFLPVSSETGKDKALVALTTLCRCFDEMRILYQVLLERFHQSGG